MPYDQRLLPAEDSPVSGSVRLSFADPHCLFVIVDLKADREVSVPGVPGGITVLCYVLRGELLYQTAAVLPHRLPKNVLFLNTSHDADCMLTMEYGTSLHAVFILFAPALFKAILYDRLGPYYDLSDLHAIPPKKLHTSSRILSAMRELFGASAPFHTAGRRYSARRLRELTELFIEQIDIHPLRLAPSKREDRARIAELTACLRAHPAEKPDLDRCADMTLMSRRKLTALFKEVTGLSIGEYRDLVRLESAKKLLTDPAVSISAVAEMLGFGSISSFSAFFKEQSGTSPSVWRKL